MGTKPSEDLELQKSPSKDLDIEVDNGVADLHLDEAVVRSLRRKADFILIPILAIGYLMNSLDRSNLANANTAGLEADLNMVGRQYNDVLTFYQIPFVVFGPVIAMLTRIIGAKYTISGMLFVFGVASLATGWVKEYHHLIVCRVFVGTFESGFLGSVIYYLSIWYTRKELASRIGIFYAALTASSAFGGLLAYGMFQVTPSSGYFRWSYLFFLEGGMTALWSIISFLVLPVDTQSAWFLNPTEKEVAVLRLEHDSVQSLSTEFSWRESLSEFATPHGYIRVVLSFIMGVILTSNANFLAMVVRRLGHGVVKTQLVVHSCASFDRSRFALSLVQVVGSLERGLHSAFSDVVSLVGYLLLFTVSTDNLAVLYFAMFLCTVGAYPSTPISATWTVANIPNLNARALTSGMFVAFGNCGGFLSSNIYLKWEAPRYSTALKTNIGMCAISISATTAYALWMRWENRRRDRLYGKPSGSTEGITSSRDPQFRFQA
ncbi:MFS domain-containing protein [Fusarium falciforme]|uniref:MFS domain-containing protein n=1 Tax=Fusarium falciforme TaxID=195108 RepID=UPI0023005241|nr:MFS domain-containing protein [Fusarium falciforme]WAO94155.1 MFS domain-containing protein [Fusarium falciforme]